MKLSNLIIPLPNKDKAFGFMASLLATATVIGSDSSAHATILWDWSFGQEEIIFTTEGSSSDLGAPGQFPLIGFEVVASQFPQNVGTDYTGSFTPFDPNERTLVFLWDGTQFQEVDDTDGSGDAVFGFVSTMIGNAATYIFEGSTGDERASFVTDGNVIFGVEEFQPVPRTNESSTTLALLGLGLAGIIKSQLKKS